MKSHRRLYQSLSIVLLALAVGSSTVACSTSTGTPAGGAHGGGHGGGGHGGGGHGGGGHGGGGHDDAHGFAGINAASLAQLRHLGHLNDPIYTEGYGLRHLGHEVGRIGGGESGGGGGGHGH